MSSDTPAMAGAQNRSLLYIGAGVAALVVITIVVVIIAGSREPTNFAADSPQGTLQRYLAAHDAGDLETAYAFFSSDVRARMDLDAYERAVDSYGSYQPDVTRSVFFDGTTGEGDSVVAQLTVEEFYGDGLEGSSYRSSREIRLVREDGAWRIDEALVWLDPAPFEALP